MGQCFVVKSTQNSPIVFAVFVVVGGARGGLQPKRRNWHHSSASLCTMELGFGLSKFAIREVID